MRHPIGRLKKYKFKIIKNLTELYLDCLVGECNYPRGSRSRPGQGGEDLQAAQKEEKRPGFRLWSSGPNFDTELPQVITLREAVERRKQSGAVTDNVRNLSVFLLDGFPYKAFCKHIGHP